MPTSSFRPRAEQVWKLLVGLNHTPDAVLLMSRHGFGEEDRREGWQRLHELTSARLPRHAPARPGARLRERLDAWQSVWLPTASACLSGNFGVVQAWLLRDLPQPDAVPSVATFLQRLLQMPSEPALGAQGGEARALLARRGLDASTVRIANHLLVLIGTAAANEDARGRAEADEDALWRWYLRWSEVAQIAITDGALLRELGVGRS